LERGLDFEDARAMFLGPHFEIEDTRKDYGETRMICYGYLLSRLVVVGYVRRENSIHIFTMRKANAREIKKIGDQIGF
jgi:uncharacterized protein